MQYSKLVETYEKLESTTKRLEKTKILSEFLKNTPENELAEAIYLIQGNVFPRWDERKIGMSSRLTLKAINITTGVSPQKIEKEWTKIGDLGLVIEKILGKNKQSTLFKDTLTIKKVFENFRKSATLEGKGTVSKKLQLVTELLTSASPKEAKYISRTITENLRIGTAEGIIRDAIVWAFLPRVENVNSEKNSKNSKEIKSLKELKKSDLKLDLIKIKDTKEARNVYNHLVTLVQDQYNMLNDFGQVALNIKNLDFKHTKITPGIPINPMLAIKSESVEEGFKAVGKPLLAEWKYDGARMQFHKNNTEVKIFTRRLENVTKQFQELIPVINKHIKANNYIIDTEVVGYNPKTNKYLPFQNISQRIKRKHDINKLSKELPVEINVFDVLYLDGKELLHKPQKKRREILEKIIKQEKRKICITKKLISSDIKKIEKFYKESLKAGNEGLMFKNLEAIYKPGRYVKGWVKLKPEREPLDLVIVKAEYGEGKRAGLLTSYTVACKTPKGLLELGKISTGIKEKEGDLTYKKLTKMLKPLIKSQKGKEVTIKPEIVLELGYDEIQKSPTYSSGFALRFPRFQKLRNDKGKNDVNSLEDIKLFYKKQTK